ncbi:LOW QUALITY PROTEIN: hypothetical protein Cgig2_016189 [Carnegiea gigantea]|uniref:Beta-1,3-glucanase n=1 Tax=Carnegiea gigantea TaxID=171969 RepID=A0A9Q1QM54_9CARY|nr:LOW QUALITY PROTEIN: hypothetical protein Cgig2_016189 [Carnegiea gigantea]
MRNYDLDEEVLRAVQGSGIKLIIAVPNDRILAIGYNPWEATQFRYVVPYASSIKYIAVGNEVSMDSPQAPLVGPAMQNNSANLGGQIKVTTAISTSLVVNAYPPSNGVFSNLGFMGPVTNFLLSNGSPLLLNVYTYFAYADPGNTGNIRLDYALLNSPYPAFTDPNNGLQYYNLFDALVDATYAALSKATMTASTNVSTPNRSTPRGTPLRPGPLETYLFEMFDENKKPGDVVERNFGLFYPNKQPKAEKISLAAAAAMVVVAFLLSILRPTEAQIGVCYGKYAGDNLPSAQDVVNLYKSNGIGSMRIYDLDEGILQAVQGSGIKLIIQVPNDNIQSIGSDPSAATQFVQRYVVPYASSIKYIAVGNEVPLNSPQAPLVGPAMQNVLNALNSANLGGQIKVTTAIGTSLVITLTPHPTVNLGFMGPVANFLASNGSPLLLNVYTYFAYADPGNTGTISLDYALFTSSNPAFTDPNNGLQYYNLFDALVDATYAALNKATTAQSNSDTKIVQSETGWPSGGFPPRSAHLLSDTKIVHSETGWPSGGFPPRSAHYTGWPPGGFPPRSAYYTNAGGGETIDNARTYYSNVISHAKQGTPLKPGPMEIYLFEMFDEDNKPGDVEKHFGLFYPNQQSKYQLNFN